MHSGRKTCSHHYGYRPQQKHILLSIYKNSLKSRASIFTCPPSVQYQKLQLLFHFKVEHWQTAPIRLFDRDSRALNDTRQICVWEPTSLFLSQSSCWGQKSHIGQLARWRTSLPCVQIVFDLFVVCQDMIYWINTSYRSTLGLWLIRFWEIPKFCKSLKFLSKPIKHNCNIVCGLDIPTGEDFQELWMCYNITWQSHLITPLADHSGCIDRPSCFSLVS